jgi:signal transduction histidine kinase
VSPNTAVPTRRGLGLRALALAAFVCAVVAESFLVMGGIAGLAASLLAILVAAGLLARWIVVPVRRIARAAHDLASGELQVRVDCGGPPEIALLGHVFNHMAAALEDGRHELEAQNEELIGQQSELQRTLSALSAEKDRIEAFFEFGALLAELTDVAGLAAAVLDEIGNLAGAEIGAVHVLRDGRYALVASRGADVAPPPEIVEEGVGLAGQALAERQAVFGASGEALCLPLFHDTRPLGVVTLLRLAGPLGQEQRQTVEHLLGQAAVALANALGYEEARRQAGMLKAVLDATRDPIRMVDRNGRVLLENSAAWELRRTLDFAPDLTTRELGALSAPLVEDQEAFLSVHRAIAHDERYEGTDEYRFLESGHAFVRFTAPVLDPEGGVLGRIFVIRDVTAERDSERVKDEFVALVSHELRTPLTSIIGYVETMLDGEVGAFSEEQEHFLRVVDRNAERLHGLVGDLLFVANLDAGKLSLECQELDLTRLVAECVEAARPSAETRGIELVFEDGAAPVLPIVGDQSRLGQVFDNLISNGLKFTSAGGRVHVRLRLEGDAVGVEVEDSGIGIPQAEQVRLFDRFYRASSATERAIPGSGLGLSIARAIVDGHGGTISVTSVEGQGSTFRVALPLEQQGARAA